MRLSEMAGLDALGMLCEVIQPASVILEDHKTAEAFTMCAKALEKPLPPVAQYMLLAKAFAPVVKAHTEECFAVAAALLGKPYEEVCKQRLTKTLMELREVWNEDLRDFFTSSSDTARGE